MKYHLAIARLRKLELSFRGNYDFQHKEMVADKAGFDKSYYGKK